MPTKIKIVSPFRHYSSTSKVDAVYEPGDEAAFVASEPTDADIQKLTRKGRLAGGIEAGFPGKAAFERAGIARQADVDQMDRDALLAVDGIGEATADEIIAARSGTSSSTKKKNK